MNILIRADSSSTIGTGHIMRDLVLAKQYPSSKIIFATQDLKGNINYKIVEAGYQIEILKSNDIEVLEELIKKLNIDMLVIDHYGIDYNFEKKLKTQNLKLKILSFDDTYEKHYCDILLNHNIYADESRYKDLVPCKCELRCGSKYTLLREEFIEEKKRSRQNNSNNTENLNVLIAIGGTDHTNLNSKILDVFEKFPNIHAHVVTTTANQHLRALEENISNKMNVTLYINTNHMAEIMNKADFAIVTPSVTMNEIFYMKIPFIAIKTAENQNEMYNYLVKYGYISLKEFNLQLFIRSLHEIYQRIINV